MLVHFGSTSRPLYGVYDPGASPRKRHGVLILNPWGWEAIRAHRTLRTLAGRLASRGVDVMRFDYSGTGDSYGELAEAEVETWLSDAEEAFDELKAMGGLSKVSVVGLRLGGLLAAHLAVRRGPDVDRLVLWEPPHSGEEFLEWMDAAPAAEAAAFPIPPTFDRDVRRLTLVGAGDFVGDALTVSSNGGDASMTGQGARNRLQTTSERPCWVEDHYNGAGTVPVALIDDIAEWLAA